MKTHGTLLVATLLTCHCGGSKTDGNAQGTGSPSERTAAATHTIDASNKEAWIYFSLKEGREVTVPNPEDSLDWDLGFKRYHIKVNGGASGSKDLSVAAVESGYDAAILPEDGYESDLPDGDDEGSDPDYALRSWYAYDPQTHILKPKDITYFVRSDGLTYRLSITGYYSSAGTPGNVQFQVRLEGDQP